MSVLIYNCITIDLVQTVRYSRQPVYDGRTYLYTRHLIHVRGLVDPAHTSYALTQQSRPNVVDEQAGQPAPDFVNRGVARSRDLGLPAQNGNLSDRAIRHLLAQPRRKLLYYSGGVDAQGNPRLNEPQFFAGGEFQDTQILESPYRNRQGGDPQYTVDANYGPNPLKYDVWRVDGSGTFRVEFAVETWVNEAHLFRTRPPLLLSNEWEMEHDLDADGFTSQTVRGRAKFRADVLETQQTTPDDYRRFLLLPAPPGFKRHNLRVRALDDGTTIHYQYTDRLTSHSLAGNPNAKNASRVEAVAYIEEGAVGPEDIAAQAATKATLNNLGLAAAVSAIQGSASYVVPQLSVRVVVRVWGNPQATRAELLLLAEQIIQAKLPRVLSPQVRTFNVAGGSVRYTLDLMGRFVQVEKSVKLPAVTRALTQVPGVLSGKGLGDTLAWVQQQAQIFANAGIPNALNPQPAPAPKPQPSFNTPDLLPELFGQDDIILPVQIPQLPVRMAAANLANPGGAVLNGYLPDQTWPTPDRASYVRLCVAAALSQWQDGPGVPPKPQPTWNPKVTTTY